VAAAAVKATKSAPAAVVVAAPVDTQMAATEKALQAVGVTGSALKLLASAEKSQTRDTFVPPRIPSVQNCAVCICMCVHGEGIVCVCVCVCVLVCLCV